MEAFRAGGREAQAESEEAELEVLEEYMPEPLSDDELERIVDDAIAEVGATSLRDFGRVMADVMPQIAGRAGGSVVSQLVREKLACGAGWLPLTQRLARTRSPDGGSASMGKRLVVWRSSHRGLLQPSGVRFLIVPIRVRSDSRWRAPARAGRSRRRSRYARPAPDASGAP